MNIQLDVTPEQLLAIAQLLNAKAEPVVPAVTSTTKPNPVVAQPTPTTPAPKPAPTPAPQPSMDELLGMDNPEAEQHTLDDIRGLVMQIAPETRISLIQEIFKRLGVAKLSDIPQDKYNYVYADLHKHFEV
jgi:hypothetical protein